MSRRGARRIVTAALAGALALAALTGCTKNGIADQYTSGDQKGYIAGTGVTEWPPSHRGKPVDFGGKTEDGTSFSSKDYRGKVVVVNFWYAECGPCRAEAKYLESDYKEYASQGVQFVGVNTENSAANARAFDAKYGVTYPSVLDAQNGSVQLAFSGDYRPNATPTTIVLDTKGRIASRLEGAATDQKGTLETLIDSALGKKD